MPHKLGFQVTQASSEDEGGRAKELLQQGPGVKGWVSSRFCLYPQELVFQLRERCHLSKVQILAHQHLIPEKVELHIGDVKEGKDATLFNAKFALLGYVALSDNQHSQFRARELKSVTVECTGTFLKLLLHKNHVNRINLYNQVGLVAINLLGNELETNNNSVSPDGEGGQVPGGDPQAVPLYHDLAFAMYVDTQVAATIRTLEDRRAAAVREKRLEYANKLKAAVSQLRTAGERLGKYEIEKRHAVDTENYDRAKVKKELAEEYREQVYKALEIDDLLERKGKLDKNDYPDTKGPRELPPPPRPRAAKPRDASPTPGSHLPPPRLTSTPPKPPPTPPKSPSPPPIKIPSAPLPDLRPPYLQPNTPRPPASPGRPYLPTPPAAPSPAAYTSPPSTYSSPYYSYDERALPALKHRDALAVAEEESEGGGGSRGRLHGLSEADKKDAALPLDVFGRDLVEKIYSKNYSEKEAGLKQLQQELANYSSQDSGVRPDRYVRGCVVLVRRALRDKVYSVGALAADTLSHILSHFISKHKVTKKELTTTLDKVLPDLLAKTADNASRNQSLATSAILEMLSLSLDRGLGSVGVEVTRPLTNTVHPRGALCRANIVEEQINALGITALPKDRDSGFTVRHLVEFAHSAFKHQNNEVRKVGERLLLALYSHYPTTVRKVLPQQDDIARKNVLYRNLFEQLEALDEKREAASTQNREQSPRISVAGAAVSVTPPHHYSSSSSCSSSGVSTGGSSAGPDLPYAGLDLSFAGHDPHRDPPGGMGCTGGVPQISITPDEAEVRGRELSRLNGSRLDLTSVDGGDLSPLDPEDRTCIFCGAFDKSFTDTGLDMHYWRSCPMLTRCNHCRQVVEVASLTQHLLGECVASSEYRRCERCSEAIPKKTFHNHALAKSCIPYKPEPVANHCPLCHDNIAPWDDGWRLHLMPGPNSCPNNLRVWQQVAKKASNEKSPFVASGGSVGGGGSSGGGSSGAVGVKPRIPGTVTPGTPRKTLNRRR
nr:centrosomal protein of 104 kDa-like [Procambarus clarkii]